MLQKKIAPEVTNLAHTDEDTSSLKDRIQELEDILHEKDAVILKQNEELDEKDAAILDKDDKLRAVILEKDHEISTLREAQEQTATWGLVNWRFVIR
jgi:hypothetical protein